MKNTMETMEINDEILETVNGGTFWPNMFNEKEYNSYGIKTNYHWEPWKKDEFILPNGEATDEDGANKYMQLVAPDLYQKKADAHAFNNRKGSGFFGTMFSWSH